MVLYWTMYWISYINIAVTEQTNTRVEILAYKTTSKLNWYITHNIDTDPLVRVSTILVCSQNNKYHSWLVPKASISKAKWPKSYLIKLFNMLYT